MGSVEIFENDEFDSGEMAFESGGIGIVGAAGKVCRSRGTSIYGDFSE